MSTDTPTANDVRDALHRHYGFVPGRLPSHIVLHEVANKAGNAGTKRYADLVAISCWPSRGLSIAGVEIKVARSDWQKELATPQKAEAFGWCDAWYVAAPKGMIPLAELPPTWGLIEVSKGKTEWRAKVVKPPVWGDTKRPVDRARLVALLTRAMDLDHNPVLRHRHMAKIADARAAGKIEAQDDELLARIRSLEREVSLLHAENRRLVRKIGEVDEFERATGVGVSVYSRPDLMKLLQMVRVLRETRWAPGRNRRGEARPAALVALARTAAAELDKCRSVASRIAAGLEVLQDGVSDETLALLNHPPQDGESQ